MKSVFGRVGLGSIRRINTHRARYILAAFFILTLFYEMLPRLIFKTPWTHVAWLDENVELDTFGKSENELVVLRWTSQWGDYETPRILTRDTCPHLSDSRALGGITSNILDLSCRITFDRRYLKRSDALTFHSFDLMREEVPKFRRADQPWIYVQQECPIYTKLNLQTYSNVFNWTMTYRRDSDVYHPYGHVISQSEPQPNLDFSSQLKNKTDLVAWIVSSCYSFSKREHLVTALKQYLNVNIYGWCGLDCPSKNCYAYVGQTHKFYLSFENSLCSDYITEKFFNALRSNIVPVIYGGTRSSDYEAIAPKGSYIDARNFKTPKDLAQYLLYLDKNDEEYMKYFEWKKTHKIIEGQGWCNLCQRVYEHKLQIGQSGKVTHKWYTDLWEWWNYMSYDTRIEVDEQSVSSNLAVIGSSYNYKLGAPACISSIKNLTAAEENGVKLKPDFEPGVFNGRVFGKVVGWIKQLVFTG